ncbi:MAG: DNA (cytosine-5-)-methyltransferase [Bacteroidales bacterium]|nr:DNA (cytosine-5-)-methyltransferase [Bacteroidales bacterium]
MYKVVSLFSGCGGADCGMLGGFEFNQTKYERLPFELVYASDIDKKAVQTHQANFETAQLVCKDICDTPSSEIPDHNVLVGGFPCQSFSTVNPTKDPFDDRANLYKQMVRIAKDKQPEICIAENVKGLMTLHKGAIFKRVIEAFNEAGYNTYYRLINSADYGVPQKRERMIMVCVRKDLDAEFIFPDTPNAGNWVPLSVAIPVLAIEDKKYYFSERAVQGMKNAKNNMKRGLAQSLDAPCLTVTSHLAKVSLNSRDPVLLVDPEKELYRRFTPREAARIQSFPDTFVFTGSEADAYRQIGNAIPPVMFWHIAKKVGELLKDLKNK